MEEPKSPKQVSFNLPIVKKVKDLEDKSKYPARHPHLPVPPFNMICCGSVRSGKTNFLVNALRSKDFWGGEDGGEPYFKKSLIISNSIHNDPKGKYLMDKYPVEDHYEDRMIDEFVKTQKLQKREDMDTAIICLDDIISKDFKRTSSIAYLCSRYRHIETSIIICTQSYRSVSNIIRCNNDYMIIFKQNNFKQLESIAEEMGEFAGSEEQFMRYYNEAIGDQPYSFLVINAQKNPVEFMIRFEKIIGYGSKPINNAVSQEEVFVDSEPQMEKEIDE